VRAAVAASQLALFANLIWFGLGFRLFWLRPRQAAYLLVRPETKGEESRTALVAAMPFLGGMNLALALMSGAALIASVCAGTPAPWQVLLGCALAHATQFAVNVPHARRGGRDGGAPWDVLRGTMRLIYTLDLACAIANAAALAVVALA
jgi:hypothetical protein